MTFKFGLVHAPLTPFADGRIDYAAYDRLLDFHIRYGAESLALPMHAGESVSLSAGERQRLLEFAIGHVAERVPLIAHVSEAGTSIAVSLAAHAQEVGAAALIATVPYYWTPPQHMLVEHFAAIGKAGALPLFVLNAPSEMADVEVTPKSVVDLIEKLPEFAGLIDTSLNNAAANLRQKAVDVTRKEWDGIITTNLTGTFFLTQAVGRHLIARGAPGRIVTIASAHALVGAAERSAYGISKAGLVQMTRMLAVEWAEHGITVNAVAPGRMMTESPSRAKTGSDPTYMGAILKRIPLHRLSTPAEVAGAVAFLLSAAASSITGQTLTIDGGLTVA